MAHLELTSCRFGTDGETIRPNTMANIAFTTGGLGRRTVQTGSVTLHACTLASPHPVGPIERPAKVWVISEDHNGVPGARKTWGAVKAQPDH